ncbi:MAG: uroporphyrinogen-III synthase [Rickettsiales bacterium]
MKIIITRPLDEARILAKKLEILGYQTILAPLLEIKFTKNVDFNQLYNYQAIIITSRNAIKAIAKVDKGLKLLILGKESYDYAKSLGFFNCIFVGENIEQLKNNILNYDNLLYLSGADVTDDLKSLKQKIDRKIIYKAEQIINPSEELLGIIKQDQLKICLFLSARTAQAFANIIVNNGLKQYCKSIISLTLSNKIAHNLEHLNFNACYVTQEATLNSLVNLINRVYNAHQR